MVACTQGIRSARAKCEAWSSQSTNQLHLCIANKGVPSIGVPQPRTPLDIARVCAHRSPSEHRTYNYATQPAYHVPRRRSQRTPPSLNPGYAAGEAIPLKFTKPFVQSSNSTREVSILSFYLSFFVSHNSLAKV